MIKLEELSPRDIEQMSYNELVGVTKETNRPPGGLNTVRTICKESLLVPGSEILEIGTSTGFTAIELARLIDARVTAIDINQMSLDEATERAQRAGVQGITFELNNAMDLSYSSSRFDMVFCGNVTSYIPDRKKALSEYTRVLKDGGFLAAVPMYYLHEPSKSLIERVSEAIKYPVNPDYKPEWQKFFQADPFVPIFSKDYRFDSIPPTRVDQYVRNILSSNHLQALRPDTRKTLREKYTSQINLFAENLSQMGYTIMLLRKENFRFDEELFTGRPEENFDGNQTS
jgi:SAM-dependent methyltransferase